MSSSLGNEKVSNIDLDNIADWIIIRESWTRKAIEVEGYEALKKISALPGGFGSNETRKKLAVQRSTLLNTQRLVKQEVNSTTNPVQTENNQEQVLLPDEKIEIQPSNEAGPSEPKPHQNERQVKLDTDRSFVTYPKGIPSQSKLLLQDDLNDLIVGVLRKYPALSYFQGYHDILSVLYLTFIPLKAIPPRSRSTSRGRIRKDKYNLHTPESLSTAAGTDGKVPLEGEGADDKLADVAQKADNNEQRGSGSSFDSNDQLKENLSSLTHAVIDRDTEEWRELRRCAEMLSLNRVRDAMGSGMEGMMGLLRILKRILKAADPELSRFSAKISPVPTLPFFALSWVLTLFSHDCDSLVPIQRMFDFLLARNPISAVYLAASILILKKPQMLAIAHQLGSEYQEDPTLLHPLFVRLPPLYPDTPSEPNPPTASTPSPKIQELQDDTVNPYKPIKLSELFSLTDTLMDRYPWDGDVIRGKEIMGEGSVVQTYSQEGDDTWTEEKMLDMIDVQVVKSGAGEISDEEEDEELRVPVRQKRNRLPRNKINTLVALGVVVLGIGIATYGFKAGGNEANWGKWWGLVLRGWIGKEGRLLEGRFGNLIGQVRKAIRDAL